MRRGRVRSSILIVMATFLMTVSPATVQAVDTSDTRLLASPAITEGRIAFVYGDDVWVAGADGTEAQRLTSHPGQERSPYFAPDRLNPPQATRLQPQWLGGFLP
jgi:tricorn protease